MMSPGQQAARRSKALLDVVSLNELRALQGRALQLRDRAAEDSEQLQNLAETESAIGACVRQKERRLSDNLDKFRRAVRKQIGIRRFMDSIRDSSAARDKSPGARPARQATRLARAPTMSSAELQGMLKAVFLELQDEQGRVTAGGLAELVRRQTGLEITTLNAANVINRIDTHVKDGVLDYVEFENAMQNREPSMGAFMGRVQELLYEVQADEECARVLLGVATVDESRRPL